MNRRRYTHATLAAFSCGLLALAPSVTAQQVATAADDTWIAVSGTVVSTAPDSLRLDYGDGVITVEMDDFDFFQEGRQLMENDQVVVYGKVDDDLFESRKIEAQTVYVDNLATHFYASAADEEEFAAWTVALPVVVGHAEVTGTVSDVDERTFTVDTGASKIRVDTSELSYNPLDKKGYPAVQLGDKVKVGGDADGSLLDSRKLQADWIVEMNG